MSDSLNLSTGALSGGLSPQRWSSKQRISRLARELAAGSSLDMRVPEGFFYRRNHTTDGADALFPAFDLMSTWTRASRAWDANWSGVSGDPVGRLEEYQADEVRYGDFGLVQEVASTNLLINPLFENATAGVIGSGGIAPFVATSGDNVVIDAHAGTEIIGTGVADGWRYMDVRVNGTPTQDIYIALAAFNEVSAVLGEQRTFSVGVQLVSGTFGNFSAVHAYFQGRTSGAVGLSGYDVQEFVPDAEHRRFVSSGTVNNTGGTTAHVQPYLRLYNTDGATAVDFTIRIFAPQVEAGLVATSPIFPIAGTPAASTRATDTFVSGARVTRASKGWYDNWSGVSGGPVGELVEFQPNTPRTGPKGLLVENASTNYVTNSMCQGAGSPAYLPTNWQLYNTATFTFSKANQTTINGWPGVDFRWLDNSTPPAGYGEILFENRTTAGDGVTSLNGNIYVGTASIAIAGGSLANVSKVAIRIREFNSGGSAVGSATELDITNLVDGTLRRFTVARTCSAGGVHVGFSVVVIPDGGGSVDLTLRLAVPQLEWAVGPSSPILSSGAIATRATDVVSITGAPWVSDGPYSVYARVAQRSTTGFDYVLTLRNTGGVDYASSYLSGANVQWFNAEDGVITENKALGPFAGQGQETEIAVRQAANDLAASTNGNDQVVDASWVLPVDPVSELRIGSNPFGSSALNGYVQAIRFFPAAETNATLETLVGNQ